MLSHARAPLPDDPVLLLAVDARLSPAAQAIGSSHAAAALAARLPQLACAPAVLRAGCCESALARLFAASEDRGLATVAFLEPDLLVRPTAVAVAVPGDVVRELADPYVPQMADLTTCGDPAAAADRERRLRALVRQAGPAAPVRLAQLARLASEAAHPT